MKSAFPKYVAALLLFGSNGVYAAGVHLTSSETVFFRSMLGGLLLATVFLITRRRSSAGLVMSRAEVACVVCAGIGQAANWLFLYEAYKRIGVGMATVLDYCGPIIVMALAPLVFRERLTAAKLAGFCVVATGFALVNVQSVNGGADVWGLVCGVMSAVSYAVMVMFNKKAGGSLGLAGVALQMAVCFAAVALYVGATEGCGFAASVPAADWPPLLMLGLVNTGIGCYLYFSSIGKLPVQTVAICGYLEPLAAVVFAALLLGESMQALQLAGAVLILGGAVFAEMSGSLPKGAPSSLRFEDAPSLAAMYESRHADVGTPVIMR